MDSKFSGIQIGWLLNRNLTMPLPLYHCEMSNTYWTNTHLGFKVKLDLGFRPINGAITNVPTYIYYGPFSIQLNPNYKRACTNEANGSYMKQPNNYICRFGSCDPCRP